MRERDRCGISAKVVGTVWPPLVRNREVLVGGGMIAMDILRAYG